MAEVMSRGEPRSGTPQPGVPTPGTPRGADTRVLTEPRARGVSVRRLLCLLMVGAVGLLLDSHGLAGWADTLPDALAPVTQAAHWWDDTIQATGLGAPYTWLHDATRRAIAAPF